MPMIRECIVTTLNEEGQPHIAPLGIIQEGEGQGDGQGDVWIIAPFSPSTTLNNLRTTPYAVANYSDDVTVFAGCLTGRRDWPTRPAEKVPGAVLEGALAHAELVVERVLEDPQRPRFLCRVVKEFNHKPFHGFNRAQAAVIEAAILVSRLHMLPAEKVRSEIDYLTIAIEKTAGPRERQAWDWLMAKLAEKRADQDKDKSAP